MIVADQPGTPTFRRLISSDLVRYTGREGRSWLSALPRCLSRPGLLASLIVRAQQCAVARGHHRVAGSLRGIGVILVGIDVAPGASIGARVWLEHPVGIVIGSGVRIGDDVTLVQGVTLGVKHSDGAHDTQLFPTIGDGVIIGARASVLGGVTIGAGAVVAAHSVVLADVPPGMLAVGAPARIVRRG